MTKVSLIIPVFNVEDYIAECMSCIIAQDYPLLECVLIDDFSSDHTRDILHRILADYHGNIDFRLILQDANQGAGAARNVGLTVATGDYFYFLDADDVLSPDAISSVVALAQVDNGMDMVQADMFCEFEKETATLSIQDKGFPRYTVDQKWIFQNFPLHIPVSPCNKLMRLSVVKEHGLYFKEGIVNEDVLWVFTLRKYIKSIAFCQKKIYRYRYNPNSVMRSPQNEQNRIKSYMLVLKELITLIDPQLAYLDSFFILKQFQHNKMMDVERSQASFFQIEFNKCIAIALQSKQIPLLFKPMFAFLQVAKDRFKTYFFVWQKSLGILYRLAKYQVQSSDKLK